MKYVLVLLVLLASKFAMAQGALPDAQNMGGKEPVSSQDAGSAKPEEPLQNVIESGIDGTFNGWTGDTVFTLTNGQVWQQTDGRYKYFYKYNPKVVIMRLGTGYTMQVDDMDDRVEVVRIK